MEVRALMTQLGSMGQGRHSSTLSAPIAGCAAVDEYHDVLAISDEHLTSLFLLFWLSLLEAMAAGCALVCSATPPVEEVLTHNSSAVLVDFFPPDQAEAIALA